MAAPNRVAWLCTALCAALSFAALADPARSPAAPEASPAVPYLFLPTPSVAADRLAERFAPPPHATRVPLAPRSFGFWLRHLPLLPAGTGVQLFDGRMKGRQDVHAAVVALDVPRRDLQQCADAIMRLRAEYLLAVGTPERIAFHPDIGMPRTLAYRGTSRADFMRFLTRVFAEAGSASLQAELQARSGPVEPGDVLIQGGHPGHAVLVLDVAERLVGATRQRLLLIGQSYMPAQQFHVVRNLSDAALSPWFDEAALDSAAGLATPEWRPFFRRDVHRFSDPAPSR